MKQKEKILHNIAAKYIMSENIEIELGGSLAEMKCLQQLLEISKKQYKAFNNYKININNDSLTINDFFN